MIGHILAFFIATCLIEPTTEGQTLSCSCKKKKKTNYQENIVACVFDEKLPTDEKA